MASGPCSRLPADLRWWFPWADWVGNQAEIQHLECSSGTASAHLPAAVIKPDMQWTGGLHAMLHLTLSQPLEELPSSHWLAALGSNLAGGVPLAEGRQGAPMQDTGPSACLPPAGPLLQATCTGLCIAMCFGMFFEED